ncbi:PP2C family protein-serine/threonine phosphatase [Flaviaesturariibacter aridisoli]|nr:protein phosphatase 2C domain-containing protein [Flaviaesturariibacter aridisoli]
MTERFYGLTDTGRQRANNEDAFVARSLPDGRLLLCVIDGVGGYEGGEVAAALAQEALEQAAHAGTLSDGASFLRVCASIQEAITIAKKADPRLAQMACVLSAALVDEKAGRFHYAHIGDTRLYLYRDGSLVKISSDHSFVGLLEDSGRISEAEAMAHPKRNEIDRALGFGTSLPDESVDTGSSPFLPGDGLLLCSDGLTDLVPRAAIEAILQHPDPLEQKAAALVAAANEAGGKDNITVVLAVHSTSRTKTRPVGAPRAAEPVVEIRPEPPAVRQAPTVRQGKRSPVWPWLLLLLLLLGAAGWWLQRHNRPPEVVVEDAPRQPFAKTMTFPADSLHLGPGDVFLQPDSLFVARDTLVISGKGSAMVAANRHSVWQVAPTVRLLQWSHLVLNDAEIRISSSNVNAIRFDSVRLVNVSIGIENPVRFHDTIVSGVLYGAPAKGGKGHE